MGMPGHLGDERVTVQNLQVMQVREADKIILVSGAVPGSNGSYVVVRPAIKKRGAATSPSLPVSLKSGAEGAAAPTKK
jgi:large subunit ribosomal protein L3